MSSYVAPSPWPVFYHRWRLYLNTWRGSVFSSFLLPVMFLVGLGISVGSYVDDSALGMPYAHFIAPGVLASTVLQVAISEAAWPVLAAFQWVRTYHAMRAAPLRPVDMVGGEILWIWLRAGTSAAGFLIVLALFGMVRSPVVALLALPAALLLAVASCTPVLAFAASIRMDNGFVLLFRFAVIPMTLFSGVFFPVDQLPLVGRWVAYGLPLWHGVELCRAATLGTSTAIGWLGHAAYLALWAVAGYLLAVYRYTRRLTD